LGKKLFSCFGRGFMDYLRDNSILAGRSLARYYSPNQQRFISEDPIGLRGGPRWGGNYFYEQTYIEARFKSDKLMEIWTTRANFDDGCNGVCKDEPEESRYLPKTAYSIKTTTIGESTFDEIRFVYGTADSARIGKEEGGENIGICYVYSKGPKEAYLIFENYPKAGRDYAINGFRLSLTNPGIECSRTEIDIFSLETGNGFKLGQNRAEFKKKGVAGFKEEGDMLTYVKEINHDFDWPPVRKDVMSELTLIEAEFRSNKLVDLRVRKFVDNSGRKIK